jgi:Rrf2 family protein
MIKVNKKTEYALMALKYIMQKNGQNLTTARELCDHFGTPFDTTAKVLQVMNQNNILDSVKGINGGYALQTPLSEVSFTQLSKMIDGKKHLDHFCHGSKGLCELHGSCNIASPLDTLNEKIKNYLNTISLQELLSGDSMKNISENM